MSVYSDHNYRRRTAALKRRAQRNNEPCALCGKPIDFTLPYTDRWAFTAEHSEPLSLGGDLLGPIIPAHRPEPATHPRATAQGPNATSPQNHQDQYQKSNDQ